MNVLTDSKQEGQLQETLELLEQMQEEMEQKELLIAELQQQLNESLDLNEKLNSENKAENIQVLKNDLRQTENLLKNEREAVKQAEVAIGGLQDKLNREKQARLYAEANQKIVEIPVEKPVLYERCGNCDKMAYSKAKDLYESKRNKLDVTYKTKVAGHNSLLLGFVLYSIMITVFQMLRSEIFMNDLNSCIRTMWAGILFVAWGIKKAAGYIAKWSDIISNDTIATIVHWIAFGIVIAVILAVLGFVVKIAVVKIKDAYKSYCWDKVTVIVTAVSLAIIVWFVDLIKAVMPVNAITILLSVQMLYVLVRWYIHGCRLTRGYY